MGNCISRSQFPPTEMSRIRKSQISPPILVCFSPERDSATSKYSYRYDPPTPPRHPVNITISPSKTAPVTRRPPLFTIQPPTPQKYDDTDAAASQEHQIRKQELDSEIAEVSIHMDKLLHSIRAYSFLATQTQVQTLSDLSSLLATLPAPPRALLARVQIQTLEQDVGGLHAEKKRAFRRAFEPALASLTELWSEFRALGDEEKRAMAARLRSGCVLMRIFDSLSLLRAACEELLALDLKIGQRVARDFDAVLTQLREAECFKRGEGGGASMQWMVLGIVEGKRWERLKEKIEAVKWERGVVSAALLGVAEALGEEVW
ncbi:hypothetical protein JHW43_008257 [Diplocarpon mali]|nr:hypothetical protein JHW43_008257 [Diplocarpon mali]